MIPLADGTMKKELLARFLALWFLIRFLLSITCMPSFYLFSNFLKETNLTIARVTKTINPITTDITLP